MRLSILIIVSIVLFFVSIFRQFGWKVALIRKPSSRTQGWVHRLWTRMGTAQAGKGEKTKACRRTGDGAGPLERSRRKFLEQVRYAFLSICTRAVTLYPARVAAPVLPCPPPPPLTPAPTPVPKRRPLPCPQHYTHISSLPRAIVSPTLSRCALLDPSSRNLSLLIKSVRRSCLY